MRVILVWLLNALALWLVTLMLPGVSFEHPWQLLMAALVMGLINAVVKPILVILTLPITVFTLGLFLLILNALLFWAAAGLVPGFVVAGFGWALLGALLYSLLTGALSLLLPERRG